MHMVPVSSLTPALESTIITRVHEKETRGLLILPHPKNGFVFKLRHPTLSGLFRKLVFSYELIRLSLSLSLSLSLCVCKKNV